MKTTLFPLLCALLLCGCSAQNPVSEPVSSLPVIAETVEPVRETPSMALLSQSPELEEYALSEAVASFLPMGDNLLFFSGGETAALTLVDPENAETLAVHEASIALTAENATVQLLENGISYFNGSARETVVLDSALREVRRISAPGRHGTAGDRNRVGLDADAGAIRTVTSGCGQGTGTYRYAVGQNTLIHTTVLPG